MDQDSTKGSDKRNWRERLGIGTTAAPSAKDLPRISDDYEVRNAQPQSAPAPPGTMRPASVKPAPMAPRPAGRSGTSGPVTPEKLAERLRSQREAQAKLAEQRVQVARQRSEQMPSAADKAVPSLSASATAVSGAKPKFTFAEEEQNAAAASASGQSLAPQTPKLTPARQPLGGTPTTSNFQPRTTTSSTGVQPPHQTQGASLRPPFAAGGLAQQSLPGYRPFEQSTIPASLPRPTPSGLGAGTSNGYAGPQRLGAPGRPGYGSGPDYPSFQSPQGAGTDPRFASARAGRMPMPSARGPAPQFEDGASEDAYYPEQMPPRAGRRSAAEYRQAYRDMEQGYEDEAPRSRGPWILLAMLVLTLGFAMAGVWYYQTYFKPTITANSSSAQVPVVQPPAGETIAQPEQPAAAEQATEPAGNKRIYDRIVGDQEVLSGQLAPAEEVPLAPPTGSSQLPEPAVQPLPGAAGADDAAPLPIPPPPGDGNTQGLLPQEPAAQTTALSNPAAGDSQAAVVPQAEASAPPPAPGETVEPVAAETIEQPETAEPVVEPVKKPVAAAKKVVAKKSSSQSLGEEPVVLVPPADSAETPVQQSETTTVAVNSGGTAPGSLYGEEDSVASTAPVATPPAVKKKKKTLADLFNGTASDTTQFTQTPKPAPVLRPAPKPLQAQVQQKPIAPVQTQVAAATGYVAQLASFRSRQEANTEFGRLKSRHGAILQGTTPIVSEATVAGSTRYRLAVGGFASKEQASALCSKLVAAGERDCLVKNQ